MGESYKGLTIRFGADNTKLIKALEEANRAASNVQTSLNRVDKALKLNPDNVDATNIKVQLLGEKAENAYKDLAQIRTAIANLDANGRLSEASANIENISMETAKAYSRFNQVNDALAYVNNQLKAIAKEFDIAWDDNNIPKVITDILACSEAMNQYGAEIRRVISLREGLVGQHYDAQNLLKIQKEIDAFRDLRIQEQLAYEEARKVAVQFVELAAKASLFDKVLDNGNSVAYFRKMKNQANATDSAIQSLTSDLERIEKLLEIDPYNLQLLGMKAQYAAEKTEALRKKTQQLTEEIKTLADASEDSGYKTRLSYEKSKVKAEEYEQELREIKGKYEAIDTEIRKINSDLSSGRFTDTQVEELNARLRELQAELNEVSDKYKEVKDARDAAFATYSEDYNQEQLKKWRLELEETKAELKAVEQQAKSTATSLEGYASAARALGISLSATVTPALMVAGMYLTNYADEFDSAYRDMRKTVQGTEEQFESLKQAAIEYSQVHPVSATTILEIEAMGGQLGIAVDELGEFAEVASNLDIATNMDSDEIAEKLGQFSNILEWSEGDMEKFSNALVRLGNNMPAQESAISDITNRIASMGHIVGMSTTEILAWSAAIAATGQGEEAAGTAIANTISDIESAVGEAGNELVQFASVANMSASEFAAAWNSSPSDALQAFIEGLRRIDESGGSVSNTLASLGITGTRQVQAIQGLTNTITTLDDALTMSEDAWNGVSDEWGQAGDAANEAAAKGEGFSGSMQLLQNSAIALGAELGGSLIPFVDDLTSLLTVATDAFAGMSDGAKSFAVNTALVVTALGPFESILASAAKYTDVNSEGYKKAADSLLDFMSSGKTYLQYLNEKTSSEAKEAAATLAALAAEKKEAAAGTARTIATIEATIATKAYSVATTAAAASSKVLTVAMKALPFIALASVVVTAVQALAGYTKSVAQSKRESDELRSSLDDMSEEIDTIVDENEELVETANGLAESSTPFSELLDRYKDLAESSDNSLESNQQLLLLVNQMSAVSSDFADSLGDEATAANLTTEAIIQLGEAEKERQQSSALSDAYTDLLEEQIVLEGKLAKAEEVRDKLQEEYYGKRNSADDPTAIYAIEYQYTGDVATAQENVDTYTEQLAANKEAQEAVTKQMAEAALKASNLQYAYGKLGNSASVTQKDLDELFSAQEDGIPTLEEFTNYCEQQAAVMEAEAIIAEEELLTSISELLEAEPALADFLSAKGLSTKGFIDELEAAGWSVDDFSSRLESLRSTATSAFSPLTLSEDNTVSAFVSGLQQNEALLTAYYENLETLASNEGLTVSSEFMDAMLEGGVSEYGTMVQQMVDALNNGAGQIDTGLTVQGVIDTYDYAVNAATEKTAAELGLKAQTAGVESAEQYQAALEANADEAGAAGSESLVESLVSGVESGEAQSAVSGSVDTLMTLATSTVESYYTDFYSKGYYLAQGLADGMKGGSSLVSSAASLLSNLACVTINKTADEHSPSKRTFESGMYLSMGFAQGISKYSYLPEQSARLMTDDTILAMQSYDLPGVSGSTAYNALPVSSGVTNNYYTINGLDYMDNARVQNAMFDLFDVMIAEGKM